MRNVGHVPVRADYHLAGSVLTTVEYYRNLGVTITYSLSMSRHISEIISKAHQHGNCILRSFTPGDESLLIRAFVVYVRPIVEYNNIIWPPHSKHDIYSVEKVLFCSLAFLDPRVGHTMDVLSPFISILCHSD